MSSSEETELTTMLLEEDRSPLANQTDQSSYGTLDQNQSANRKIFVKELEKNHAFKYPNNKISTAKYNLLIFFPKFFYEQFSRYANLFFLFMALAQQLPGTSPTGRWTTAGPLLVVLTLLAIKELLEDRKRHQADAEVNNRQVRVFRHGTFQTIKWTEVKVGDVVKVLDKEFFPADLIMLSSSEQQGICYVETANLDGETNLKLRQAAEETWHLIDPTTLRGWDAVLECEPPNNHLYNFVGNLMMRDESGSNITLPISADQLLQRGAQLRNTHWIYGIVVYTGHQTKLLKNATAAPIKRSNVDNVYNRQIINLFITLLILAIVSAIGYQVWANRHKREDWYLAFSFQGVQNAALSFFTFVILYNNIIPISLIIQLDIVKYIQALVFINNDLKMYYAPTDTPARAQTSSLNEELGQVQYIFSDKTGTLTRNEMQFQKCSIGGVAYGDCPPLNVSGNESAFNDPSLLDNLTSGHETASIIREWLTALAVCHTVVPERDPDDPTRLEYQATSPDEAALVKAAKSLGFSFNVRKPNSIVINALGDDEEYQILNVLEFNSTRKRMSIIVKTPDNTIKLYCKGADDKIMARLAPNQHFVDSTNEHLKTFASDGLRTLCIAVVELDPEEYQAWAVKFKQANEALENRSEKMDEVAELIEKDLHLLGATAIEDRLQDDVPSTIKNLADAGIRIWVCTGDKLETAINIGYSCKLLRSQMTVLIAQATSTNEMKSWLQDQVSQYGTGVIHEDLALVIEGSTLQHGLQDDVKQLFLEFAQSCKAVIACRVSPLQKADLVRLVRKRVQAITLAIGDGANDVGMIQAAHVGVGISGNEGLQAARAADYAIGQFKYLQRLLLVHGSWSYHRITILILYSFYKNIALYLIELWFAFDNGFSGQILFEKWTIATFNVIFTLLPPIALGMFDQHLNERSLMTNPKLYARGQNREGFNSKVFVYWLINAIAHSVLFYYLPVQVWKYGTVRHDGLVAGQWLIGNVVFGIVVIAVTFKAAMITKYWTVWNHVALWGSIVVWMLYNFIYCNLFPLGFLGTNGSELYGVDILMFGTGVSWLSFFLFPLLVLLPDFTYDLAKSYFFPSIEDSLRAQEELEVPHMPESVTQDLRSSVESDRRYTGYAFSQVESNAHITQTDVVQHVDSTLEKPSGE